MKLGMTSLTLRNENVENVIKYAKIAGLDGIEWGVSDGHVILGDNEHLKKIKRLSKENEIEIFSVGSYCHMTDRDECVQTVHSAAVLGASVIRIWAGGKSPCECDEEYKNQIIENTIFMAEEAEKYNIKLGFEYHGYTLTETAESAVEVIKSIDRKNVGLYWQPDREISVEENLKNRNLVLPYLVGNMHVQNHTKAYGYGLLSDMTDRLHAYFDDIKEKPYNLMIEFVKDGMPENLIKDAEILNSIIK